MRIQRQLPVSTTARDSRAEALDLLIDQNQKLFALYDARRSNAEAKAAGILTATVAIGALTATAASLAKHVNVVLAAVMIVLLGASIVSAIYAGSAAGLRGPRRQTERTKSQPPILSTESAEFRKAAHALNEAVEEILKEHEGEATDGISLRMQTLKLWHARQLDAHYLAKKKDRGAAVAGVILGLALVCGAAMVVVLVAHAR